MKRVLVLFTGIMFLFCLSGCVTVNKNYRLSNVREVESVEIYDTEKRYYEGDVHGFREENEPILTIPAEDCTESLKEIDELEYKAEEVLFPMPMDGGCDYQGYILIVVYTDGSYDLLADGGMYLLRVGDEGERSAKFDHSDYCGEEEWSDFVKRHIEDKAD